MRLPKGFRSCTCGTCRDSPHVPQVACLRYQFVLARIRVDTEEAGHHVLDAQPPLSWPHDRTSRMSRLSGTTPLTEHINCSICCVSSLHAEARPADLTSLQHNPTLRVRHDIHLRVTGALHYPPLPLLTDGSAPTSWHQIALCIPDELHHSRLLAR